MSDKIIEFVKYGIPALLLGVGLAACTIFFAERREAGRTAEATPVILETRATRIPTGKGGTSGPGYEISFHYTVNGRTYETRSKLFREHWQPPQPLKVCYNPDNPKSARVRPVTFRCGATWPR